MSLQEENSNLTTTITLDPEASNISLPAKNATETWGEQSGKTNLAQLEEKENIVPDFSSNAKLRRKDPRLR